MSDKYCGLTVSLTRDIRDDDAQSIVAAIKMVRGVQDVMPILATPEMAIAEERARIKLQTVINAALRPERVFFD